MKKIIYIIFILQGLSSGLYAQQVPLYSQYMMNGFLLNPAVAGSEGYTAINITAREQWVGLKDSPSTHSISFQSRILKYSIYARHASPRRRRIKSRSGNVGLGGYIFKDRNGPIDRTGAHFTYAYHIPMYRSQLSFGVSGIAYQFSIDETRIRLEEEGDELYLNASKSVFIPDAVVGVYYTHQKYYAGFSISQLFQSSLILGESKRYAKYKMKRYYFLTGGYDIYINDFFTIQPSVLLKGNEDLTWQADIHTKFIFQDEYWAGLSYRTNGAVIFTGGVTVEKFFFGYAFDYALTSIMKRTFGSHEFMIAIKMGDSARKFRWLNRY